MRKASKAGLQAQRSVDRAGANGPARAGHPGQGQLGLMVVRVLLALWMCLLLSGPVEADPGRKADDIPDGWKLAPRIGVAVELGGYAFQQHDYHSMLRRLVEIDLLQYRRHIFYLAFDEKTLFGVPGNTWQFNLMKFDAILGGYRYDFGEFYLGVFLHHRCNNIYLTKDYRTYFDRERANVYDVGVEFLTKNLRVGLKDRGIPFDFPDQWQFLDRWAGGFWASKTTTDDRIDLDWIIRAQVRWDILRYNQFIPYVEATAEALLGPENRVVPAVEVGVRYRLTPRVDLTPFFKWSRDQLALTTSFLPPRSPSVTANYVFGGVRLEAMLDETSFKTSAAPGLQLFPEIHGQAGYAFFLNNPNFKGCGDIQLYFHALRYNSWTVFVDTNMDLNTRKEDLKPDKITYRLQYGLTHYWETYFAEGFIQNQARLDSNIYRGTDERSNLAGVRLGTRGMKPGYVNYGISFDGPQTFQWLNNLQAQAGAGHFFRNRDWQYLWDMAAQVRWDILRWHIMIPYVFGEINWRAGGGPTRDAWEYAVEPGLRFHGVFDFVVYYRFQRVKDNLFFRDNYQNQNLVGIKVLF